MTMFNEAARLFFAISALVLVGLLSNPQDPSLLLTQAEKEPTRIEKSNSAPARVHQVVKTEPPLPKTEKKLARKSLLKKS